MITVYEVPITKWEKRSEKPKKSVIDNCIIVGEGDNYEAALWDLVNHINGDMVDDVNCYLYIEETE